jgi:membrane protease YdiL (CAAX protease family)
MFRQRSTWLILGLIAAAALLLAGRNMERAFPLIRVDVELDRTGALERATGLAVRYDWGTATHRQAATFGNQSEDLQTYIEMEAGGTDAWLALIESGVYRPYLWLVRQFQEAVILEALVRFAPDGTPWGFLLMLPEDEAGASLSADVARTLAEREAAAAWAVDLDQYELVQSSQEVRPGGRTDHEFVYQWTGETYGDARFRLRLGVAGARLAEVTRYAEVPDAFLRRYAELRSTNDLIALIAGLAAGLLYLGLGGGAGLVLLLRSHAVVWRPALGWAALVAALVLAASLNALPLNWFYYDTAVPAQSFLAGEVLSAVLGFAATLLLLSAVLIVGEGLSRRALPDQLQLWRFWSHGIGNSRPVLGATLGGYLFAVFFMAYAVGFYLLATRVFGWTVTADVLTEPDLLATPLPWVSAIGISLMAGLSEEAMFRAIPLAGAAVLGTHYGRRDLWIGAALVVQAVIFACAHANYPQQPPYARAVELFLPALALGLVFLRFGLVPAVIAHYAYNLTWFSLPLFATTAQGIWVSRLAVVMGGLLPLGVVLVARLRWGAADAAPASAYNCAWRPPQPAPPPVPAAAQPPSMQARTSPAPAGGSGDAAMEPGRAMVGQAGHAPWSGGVAGLEGRQPGDVDVHPAGRHTAQVLAYAPLAVLTGLALWVLSAPARSDGPPLRVTAAEAEQIARSGLAALGEPLAGRIAAGAPEWRALPTVGGAPGLPHTFVWQTSGPTAYRALLGSLLPPPLWNVRFARFEGTLEQRAEEYLVQVGPDGSVHRIRHTIPEARAGEALSEQAARVLAFDAIVSRFGMAAGDLDEISARAQRRPARTDWTFTYAAPAPVELNQGETRVGAEIAGDLASDAWRFVYVPESWEREERGREQRRSIIAIAAGAWLGLLLVGALLAGVILISRHGMPGRRFGSLALALVALFTVDAANRWPSLLGGFDTAQPFIHQVFVALSGLARAAARAGSAGRPGCRCAGRGNRIVAVDAAPPATAELAELFRR